MTTVAAFSTTALSIVAKTTIFALGALFILAYVLITSAAGSVRWCGDVWHRASTGQHREAATHVVAR